MSRILIVDDEPYILKAFSKLLGTDGHEVTIASSGEEAIALIITHCYDLIFLDLMMPNMDGIEVLHKIRLELKLDIPVYLVTGVYDTYSPRLDALRAEGFSFTILPKPIKGSSLQLIARSFSTECP